MKSKQNNILVVCYIYSDQSEQLSARLVSEAVRLGRVLQGKVHVFLIGQNRKKAADEISKYGADKLYILEEEMAEQEEIYADAVEKLIYAICPEIVLFAASIMTKHIAPSLAARFHTGLTAECMGFSIEMEGKRLLQRRPALGNRVMATIICPKRYPQMATVLPDYFELQEKSGRQTEIIMLPPNYIQKKPMERILKIADCRETAITNCSDIIATVGRGAAEPEIFPMILDFTKLTGARLGATRAVVDAGLLDYQYQIGLTGANISCRLYFAFGVSGASQHLMGVRKADTIIAVNKDPHADIMEHCHFGIVGETQKVLPEMLEYIKKNKEKLKYAGKRRGLN